MNKVIHQAIGQLAQVQVLLQELVLEFLLVLHVIAHSLCLEKDRLSMEVWGQLCGASAVDRP